MTINTPTTILITPCLLSLALIHQQSLPIIPFNRHRFLIYVSVAGWLFLLAWWLYAVVLFLHQVDMDKASVVWEAYLHNQLLPQRLSTLPVKSDRAQSDISVKSDRAQSNLLRIYERGPFLRPFSLMLFDDAAVLTMPYGELGTLIHVISGTLT